MNYDFNLVNMTNRSMINKANLVYKAYTNACILKRLCIDVGGSYKLKSLSQLAFNQIEVDAVNK